MAAGGDQPAQMAEWIKRVEKCGYIVERDRMLYKIRDPKTRGLIITAPQFPRGNQVLRDTINRAKKNGIDVERLEAKMSPKRLGGEAPPPVASPLPPEMQRRAEEHEQQQRERAAAAQQQETQVTERKESPKKAGRGPTTPAKIAATAAAVQLVKRALNVMGGDTFDNRMELYEFGKARAIREGRRYVADSAQNERGAVRAHFYKLLGDEPGGMFGWVDEFWTITARAKIVEMSGREGVGEETAPEPTAEPPVVEMADDSEETILALRESVTSLTEDLSDERDAHRQTTAQLVEARRTIADLRTSIGALESDLDNARDSIKNTVEEGHTGANGHPQIGVVADELSVVVLRRMLLRHFPDGEEAINDAIDFAGEVVRRVG